MCCFCRKSVPLSEAERSALLDEPDWQIANAQLVLNFGVEEYEGMHFNRLGMARKICCAYADQIVKWRQMP